MRYNKEEDYEVRNLQIELKLKDIGEVLAESLQDIKGYGFTLFLFQYGPGGNMFYISSAERESMIEALQEFLRKQAEAKHDASNSSGPLTRDPNH